ncbi:adenosine receptor A3 [Biomphalaria glabrata]|nr:adenosine receptor A3-like [Biomphalaria glabrata]
MFGTEKDFELIDALFFVAEFLIGFVAVSLNSLVVLAIVKHRSLHSITNGFICNLAAADITVGLFVTPFAAMSYVGYPGNFYGCLFINCILLILTNVSIINLLVIALDRFFAVKSPLRYQKVMTMRKVYCINCGIWLLGINTGLIPIYGWSQPYRELTFCRFIDVIKMEHMVYLQFFGIILTSNIIMFAVYTYICLVVRKHSTQIDEMNLRFASQTDIKRATKWYRKEVKASKLIVLAVALFICITPINIFNCITLFCKTCTYSYALFLCTILLSHCNSCMNPILYATSNSSIKAAMKRLILYALNISPEGLQLVMSSSYTGVTPSRSRDVYRLSEKSFYSQERTKSSFKSSVIEVTTHSPELESSV